ncbi:MAG: L-aspartate oxidase [Lentisphaeria bacterium]|nr:L-aspartate oxidase [Lentisphaeria bacterium]
MDSEQAYFESDFLVIGSGCAGLSAALSAAEHGSVTIITKKEIEDCNTQWAQGGIACVLDDKDNFASHVEDTLKAGAGICKEDIVRIIIEEGPGAIQKLIDLGFQYTTREEMGELDKGQEMDLGREGGHSHRRVIHAGDVTGEEIVRVLKKACLAHPNITIKANHQAVDLLASRRLGWDGPNKCLGAWVMDREDYVTHAYIAKYTFLATGGAGKVYLYSSNPDVACGEGIAMAYRAYAEVANMEFYQFHPTILHSSRDKSFLVSEAVRGEGAILKSMRNGKLTSFMEEYHELGSLATRDIVARAIDQELKKYGHPCVYLDITHKDEDYLRKRFPRIFDSCFKIGVNMANDPIPVVPAAHYCCGGVRTNEDAQTCVEQLYAIGEVACTGLHGANRLASNGLLEGLVMANRAVQHAVSVMDDIEFTYMGMDASRKVPAWNSGEAADPDELIVLSHNWDEIRRFMWDYVGIFRTDKRLLRAKSRIKNIRKEIEQFYWDFTLTPDLVELRNLASVAEMIIDSALARKESIGLHFNADRPIGDETAEKETILRRPGFTKSLH